MKDEVYGIYTFFIGTIGLLELFVAQDKEVTTKI